MQKFVFSFTGRQVRAIGIFYRIRDTYTAANLGQALYKLYTDYEHITDIKIKGKGGRELSREGVELEPCDVSECYPNRPRNEKGAYLKKVN